MIEIPPEPGATRRLGVWITALMLPLWALVTSVHGRQMVREGDPVGAAVLVGASFALVGVAGAIALRNTRPGPVRYDRQQGIVTVARGPVAYVLFAAHGAPVQVGETARAWCLWEPKTSRRVWLAKWIYPSLGAELVAAGLAVGEPPRRGVVARVAAVGVTALATAYILMFVLYAAFG